METIEKNVNTYDASQLATKVESKVEELKTYIQNKGYRVKGEFPEIDNTAEGIADLSKRKKKKLNKYLRRGKYSLKYLNTFFVFLYRDVLQSDDRVKILVPEKEAQIQKARKAWKTSQSVAEELRLAYKAEKGDYYKS